MKTADLDAVLTACEQLYAPAPIGSFSTRMLAALKPVLSSAIYSWELLSTAEIKPISALCEDDRGPLELSREMPAYLTYARQHPFAAAALSTAEQSIVTRRELLPDRRWERTDFYNLVLSPLGVKDQLSLTLRGDKAFGALVFHFDRAVSDRSRRILQLLAPHIRQAMNASFRWEEATGAGVRDLRAGRVLLDFTGRVTEMEPTALAVLQYHFANERVSDRMLPVAVRDWFDGAARAMWSASEPAALREASVATPVGRLRLTLLTQFAERRHVVLVAAEHAPPLARAAQEQTLAQLTPREREVLSWIAEGKRNAEIAVILGSKPSTVKTQVEVILRKLCVETRGAAAVMWRADR